LQPVWPWWMPPVVEAATTIKDRKPSLKVN
jgi:hypothetical protein